MTRSHRLAIGALITLCSFSTASAMPFDGRVDEPRRALTPRQCITLLSLDRTLSFAEKAKIVEGCDATDGSQMDFLKEKLQYEEIILRVAMGAAEQVDCMQRLGSGVELTKEEERMFNILCNFGSPGALAPVNMLAQNQSVTDVLYAIRKGREALLETSVADLGTDPESRYVTRRQAKIDKAFRVAAAFLCGIVLSLWLFFGINKKSASSRPANDVAPPPGSPTTGGPK